MLIDHIAKVPHSLKGKLRHVRAGVAAFTWLGTGSAASLCVCVGNTLFGWSTIEPAIPFAISFVATGTLLMGIAAASRSCNAVVSAAVVSAVWLFVAGLAAQTTPLLAGILCLAAVASMINLSDYILKPAQRDLPADTNHKPVDCSVLISRQGALLTQCTLGDLQLDAKTNLVERVHITEQVAVLHDLQDIATGEATERQRVVLFDVSSIDEPSRYVDLDITFANGAKGIVVQHALVLEAPQAMQDHSEAHKRILAVASHELRTPLNAIIGFSDMLRTKTFGEFNDPRQEEYVSMIYDAGHDLLVMVNTILDVSKIEAGSYALHTEPFDISKTISETMRLVDADAKEKKLHMTIHCDVDDADYVADRRAIRQILTNLLSNAVKFTPEGGCIGVELSRLSDGGFKIRVTDTGIGISESEIATLFKPFVQVDNAYTRQCEGTGLGLALVKGLVELHGGSLDVTSDTNIGTAMTVTFPRITQNLVQLTDHTPSDGAETAAMDALFKRKAI